MSEMKKEIGRLVLVGCSILVLLSFYIDFPIIQTIGSELKLWAVILSGFAFGVGTINFISHHSKIIIEKRKEAYMNIWTLIVMVYAIIMGLLPPLGEGQAFISLYNSVILPLTTSTLSIIGFFMIAAAFRSFRARDKKSVVFLLSGLSIIAMNAPIFSIVWPGFTDIGQWILKVPNAAGFRAFIITTGLGALAWSIRTLTGKERGTEL